jgi:hypothetical protein
MYGAKIKMKKNDNILVEREIGEMRCLRIIYEFQMETSPPPFAFFFPYLLPIISINVL